MTTNATARTKVSRPGGAPAAHGPLVVLALAAGLASLPGCGFSIWSHPRADLTATTGQAAKKDLPAEIAETRAAMALSPTEAWLPYRLGALYMAADSTARAEQAFRQALAIDPYHAPTLSMLSRLYFQSGHHADAIEMLEKARAHPQGFAGGMPVELLEGLALHYDAVDRLGDARAVMRAAHPESDAGASSAVVFFTLRGESVQGAGDLAERAVRARPKSAVDQNNFGVTRLKAGDADAAERAFEKAIDLDASLPGPYYNMAILAKYYRLDDEAAEKWFRRYRERASEDPDGLAQALEQSRPKALAERKD
jgi:Flp pilus assembly protein TadD